MIGTRLVVTIFDSKSKGDWLLIDFNGVLYTWIGMQVVGISLFLLASAVGINLNWPLEYFGAPSDSKIGLLLSFGVTFVVAFIIVFVCRLNFTVTGKQRQFRYIFRWL